MNEDKMAGLAVLVAAGVLAVWSYVGIGLVSAAKVYASSQRYALLSIQRERGMAITFDTASGTVSAVPLPSELQQ